jgi:predicted  nucleic acid-binding Zn-ribbon protein
MPSDLDGLKREASDYQAMSDAISALETELDRLRSRAVAAETERDLLRQTVAGMQTTNDELRAQWKACETACAQLRAEVERLVRHINVIEAAG